MIALSIAWIITAFFGSIIDSMVGRAKDDYPRIWMKTYQDFFWLTAFCLIIPSVWVIASHNDWIWHQFVGIGLTLGGIVWDSFYGYWNSNNIFARARTWLNFPFWRIDFKDMKLAHLLRLIGYILIFLFLH